MPVIEYLEDSEHESSGREIPAGSQHIVTREKAKELCDEQEIAVIVGTQTGRKVQDRTRGVNNAIKGEKSNRVKKKMRSTGDGSQQAVSTDMNADKAIAYIKGNSLDDLEGFVPEDEDRTTVLKAYNDKKGDE